MALWSLARGGARVIFAPVAAALGRFRDNAFYASLALELKVGDELNLDDLVEHLRSVGYEPGEPVAAVGQYSVRGGIVDAFPPEAEWPFRLEFFGDQLESVREFDPSSQRSRKPTPHALLLPLSESQRSPQFFERLVRVLILRAREHAQSRGRGTYQHFSGMGILRSPRRTPYANAIFAVAAPGGDLGRTSRSAHPGPQHRGELGGGL